jgi:hypothetical protein
MDRCYGKTDRNYGKTGPSPSLLHPPQAPLGYRQHMGNEQKLGVVALSGPYDGSYSVLNEPGRDGGKRASSRAKTKYGPWARLQDWVHLHTGGRSALVDDREAEP